MLSMVLCLVLSGSGSALETPVNERCPVTGFDVRNHLVFHHVTVNGRRYFVFDREAGVRLRLNPECYLDAQGKPRQAFCRTRVP